MNAITILAAIALLFSVAAIVKRDWPVLTAIAVILLSIAVLILKYPPK